MLSRFGDEAPQAAKGLSSIVGKVYYISGGSDGPRGWKASSAELSVQNEHKHTIELVVQSMQEDG